MYKNRIIKLRSLTLWLKKMMTKNQINSVWCNFKKEKIVKIPYDREK